jgi:serine/threonine protein kinase
MNPRDLSDDDIAPLLRIGLEEDGDDPMPASPPQSWEPPSVEELQRALPQYEISGFIARGGMGAVYRGTQKALRRSVAIKVLPPGIDDGDRQFTERFKREAQTMARLSHPNIVTVYEAGEVHSSPLAPREEHSASAGGERARVTHLRALPRMGSRWSEVSVVIPGPSHATGRVYPGCENRLFQREVVNGVEVVRV